MEDSKMIDKNALEKRLESLLKQRATAQNNLSKALSEVQTISGAIQEVQYLMSIVDTEAK
jgi:methylthioribose-1-phosphate isomerase